MVSPVNLGNGRLRALRFHRRCCGIPGWNRLSRRAAQIARAEVIKHGLLEQDRPSRPLPAVRGHRSGHRAGDAVGH